MVMLIHTHTAYHFQRLAFGKQGCTTVALLFGAVPVLLIAVTIHLCLSRLHLSLLQTEHVRIQCMENILKALAQAGTQAVYIP